MGRPYPGHRTAVIDENGLQLGPGKMGEIAFYAPGDPIVFFKYWNNEQDTRENILEIGSAAEMREVSMRMAFSGFQDAPMM